MKSVSISYKAVNLVVTLVWVASLSAMEPRDDNLVSSQDIKDLSASIMMAEGQEEPLQKNSLGWFVSSWSWSDWWHGLDTNVVSQLKEGTLTKEALAQSKPLQTRVYNAIDEAIKSKKTENLCVLLNQLKKFELVLGEQQHESITLFLNNQIPMVCQKKASAQLITIINTMKAADLSVNNDLLGGINAVLDEQKECNIQIFKNNMHKTQELTLQLKEQMKNNSEGPLLEAQEILCLQKYLAGEEEPTMKQVKEDLDIDNDLKELSTFVKAIKIFSEKNSAEKK